MTVRDSVLFEPIAIGSRTVPNRFVANPVERNIGFDGIDCKQCHGSLPSRLIGKANQREDKWGNKCEGCVELFSRAKAVACVRE